MDVIVNGTMSIDEYKAVRKSLEERANAFYKTHKKAFENWEYGEPVRVERDKDDVLCVTYESGKWFHYDFRQDGLEWW